ncbi:MAG TPA: PaaX family transcriptional regulator C-terminal domain-containing protein [Chthoniobacterales bacterium]|nr:PaaX family transcriptional regulator C-terminal domain-containing protein [Chthoniobacterales bacterium]
MSNTDSSSAAPRPAIRKWIRRSLTYDPPRAKSLVVTTFGDSIGPHGGSIRLKGLIDLLAPFGVNQRLVRTSVFRLVQEQWLHPKKHGRESSYQLTESGKRRFMLACAKIYERRTPEWNGRWTLVALPLNSITPQLRTSLRKELEWQGLRLLAPNLLGHPQVNRAVLEEVFDRLHVRRKIITCQAIESGVAGTRGLSELVKSAWDLSLVTRSYRDFLHRFSVLDRLSEELGLITPEEWFITRTLLIHAFRRIVLHDPFLPAELLPRAWIGAEVYAFVGRIYLRSLTGSEAHLNAIIGSSPAEARAAGKQLRERFRADGR